jgi:hypothetical protein
MLNQEVYDWLENPYERFFCALFGIITKNCWRRGNYLGPGTNRGIIADIFLNGARPLPFRMFRNA